MNAWWERNELTYVMRDPSGAVRTRALPAEHSCFVLAAALGARAERLRTHRDVAWMHEQPDGWLRVSFRSREAVVAFCSAARKDNIETFEGGISPVLRWMADNGVMPERPRIAWIDLETDSRVPFSRKEQMRILCWYLWGEDGQTFGGMLHSDSDKRERELLEQLWCALDGYDLIAAWNGDRFDFPVLKARSRDRGLLVRREWRRWLWLDHLELFRRMNMMAAESGEEKQSYALGNVAKVLLGEGKHDFDSSKTWEAWLAGGESRRRLFAYCEQDTRLMPRIEEKTGYIELLLTLGQACGTFADSRGIAPSGHVEGFLQRLALAQEYRFPTQASRRAFIPYKGAYVMEPSMKGIVRDVHVADFASLYPSIIISWNMSPETLALKTSERPVAGHALSPLTNSLFRTDAPGVLALATAELLRLRKEWSDRKAKAAPGTDEWKDADRRSTAYKIAANSFYGVVGQPVSRFFTREVAEGVSQCGVHLLKLVIGAAQGQGLDVIYADTDSIFVRGCTREAFEKFVAYCNERLIPEELTYLGCQQNRVKLAYEKQFERVVFVSMKRYAARYLHYKGTAATAESRPEVKGLEYKRGDSIVLARTLQYSVVEGLVGGEPSDDPAAFERILLDFHQRILTGALALADVVVSKRLDKPLREYAVKTKKDGTRARQAPHVEIARLLEERGRDVNEGVKVEYVVTDFRQKPNTIVPAEDWDGQIDRPGLWSTLVLPPTLRLLEAAFPGHAWPSFEAPAADSDQQSLSL